MVEKPGERLEMTDRKDRTDVRTLILLRRIRLCLFAMLLALFFAFPAQAAPGSIKITGSTVVAKGKSIWLTADQPVKWKSSKPSVAKITKKGRVKGRRPGTTVITAISKQNKRVKAKIRIRVMKKPVKQIRLSMTSLTLDVTKKPTAVISAAAAPARAAQVFVWSSSAPWIVDIDAGGMAKARQAGEASITCTAADGSGRSVTIPVVVTDKVREAKEAAAREASYCNILLIGNSYTQDEFGYVPALLKEFYPSQRFRIGLLYTGGASLELHRTNLNGNQPYQTYSEYTSESSRWTHKANVRLSDVITKYAWKIITLQQCSQLQGDEASMEPITALLNGYTQKMGRQPVYLFVFPHVRGARNPLISSYGSSTEKAYSSFCTIAQNVLRTFRFTSIIPNATAIENARKTALNTLPCGGGDLTSDTTHLQDGLPCLVANYCSFLRLLPYMGLQQVDLTRSRIMPTAAWIASQSVPGADGQSIGVTEDNRLLAVKCALKAVQSPYAISAVQ